MTLVFKRIFFVLAMICGFAPLQAYAQCTPGIPCTSYTVGNGQNDWKSTDSPLSVSDYTCDGDFMNQIYNEAWMAATRDIAMNAAIVRKPDSVLEYTCFDQLPGVIASSAGPIFSETDSWINREVTLKTHDETRTITFTVDFPSDHLDNAINQFLFDVLNPYISTNFSHTYLGGSAGAIPASSGGYNCTQMESVWQLAKCEDFGTDDKFVSFGQLMTGDPRQLLGSCRGGPINVTAGEPPSALSIPPLPAVPYYSTYVQELSTNSYFIPFLMPQTNPCPAAGSGNLIKSDMIRAANNCENKYSAFDSATAYFEYTIAPYNPDLLSYMKEVLVYWPAKGNGDLCGPPIPTGIVLPYYIITDASMPAIPPFTTSSLTTALNPSLLLTASVPALMNGLSMGLAYEEHVCANPSCFYTPGLNICSPHPP